MYMSEQVLFMTARWVRMAWLFLAYDIFCMSLHFTFKSSYSGLTDLFSFNRIFIITKQKNGLCHNFGMKR